MARKTVDFTVKVAGRDVGKMFRISELPATQAERWGLRALNIMSKSLGGFPPSMLGAGMQGLTAIGISAFARANWEEMEPLMNEMFTCIQIIPNPANTSITRALLEDDIEEVATRLLLRQEVLDLHLGFFKAAVNWILTAAQQKLQPVDPADDTSNIPTSQPQSAS